MPKSIWELPDSFWHVFGHVLGYISKLDEPLWRACWRRRKAKLTAGGLLATLMKNTHVDPWTATNSLLNPRATIFILLHPQMLPLQLGTLILISPNLVKYD